MVTGQLSMSGAVLNGRMGSGRTLPHCHVVVVEDLLSTGGSAISTVEAIREEGAGDVSDIVAIFTYEFSSSLGAAQEAGVQLHPLTTLTTLLAVAKQQGRITAKDVEMIAAFTRDPERWAIS